MALWAEPKQKRPAGLLLDVSKVLQEGRGEM